MKDNKPMQVAFRKINSMLLFIARGFEYKSKDVLPPLYRAREIALEYCAQFPSPYPKKDTFATEAAKMYQIGPQDGRFF